VDDADIRARLDELTHILRPLHKLLVEVVRRDFERQRGVHVATPVQLFHLLTQDPFFLWLHPMSALMAEIDELYDSKEPLAPAALTGVRDTLASLVAEGKEPPAPDSFVSRYLAILQENADVIMQHAKLRRALDRLY
jgi:hypothetical protein